MSKIILATNQFSVVVKGLQKELTNLNHEVILIDKGFENIADDSEGVEAVVLYLPDAMLEDSKKVRELYSVCDMVYDNGCGMVLIGSGRNHESFNKKVPLLKDFTWIDRPVDINDLADAVKEEIDKARKRMAKKKILIVDDDSVYGMMIGKWLQKKYTVSVVTDGMQTISYLTNNYVDLILLDYEMPVVDGPSILEMLRSHEETSSIPVMFLTGVRDKASIQRVVKLKPEGYILKSSTRNEILDTLTDYFIKHS